MPHVVTFTDTDKVDIYGFYRDDPDPIHIDRVRVDHAESRLASLAASMSTDWHLVIYHKVTACKAAGFKQKRTYGPKKTPQAHR